MAAAERSPASLWNETYEAKGRAGVSWHQDHPGPSLEGLDVGGVTSDRSVIDVGGGASALVDALLERGHRDVTVLDASEEALSLSRARLAGRAELVSWRCQDLLTWSPERTYDVWHDRAVFHFLTTVEERDQYRAAVSSATQERSVLVIATFAADGPRTCSGLPVVGYSMDELATQLPVGFRAVRTWRQEHRTPWDTVQPFTWMVARTRS